MDFLVGLESPDNGTQSNIRGRHINKQAFFFISKIWMIDIFCAFFNMQEKRIVQR